MKKENLNRILWISDIHFSVAYKEVIKDRKYENYIEHFLTKVRSENQEAPFDYLLISGDLAQSGSIEDYELFWEHFLKKLLDVFLLPAFKNNSVPLVITIPGNHDVKWDNADFLTEYLEAIVPQVNTPVDKDSFLSHRPDKFNELFKDYSTFLTEFVSQDKFKAYQPFFNAEKNSPRLTVCPGYARHRLYGHIIDHSRKMIFLLLNSAWYSLGGKFNKMQAQKIILDPNFKKNIDFIEDVLAEKDILSEYNSQVSGASVLDSTLMNKIINEFNDYVMVAVMHHPMNWLAWDQYYTYNKDKHETADIFRELMNKADLLLTGHEHVPLEIPADTVFDNTLHLKGGCFLFDNQHEGLRLANSWFSVLDIDPFKGNLVQRKYYFDDSSSAQNWNASDVPRVNFVKKNDRYLLREDRFQRIISQLKRTDDEALLTEYLTELFLKEPEVTLERAAIACPHSTVFSCEHDNHYNLYLVAREEDYYKKVTGNEKRNSQILSVMKKKKYAKITVRFVVPDLLTLPTAKSKYQDTRNTRQEALHSIAKMADLAFDRLRHYFFMPTDKKQYQRVKELSKMGEIRLVNHVVPYFIFEKFWINFENSRD